MSLKITGPNNVFGVHNMTGINPVKRVSREIEKLDSCTFSSEAVNCQVAASAIKAIPERTELLERIAKDYENGKMPSSSQIASKMLGLE